MLSLLKQDEKTVEDVYTRTEIPQEVFYATISQIRKWQTMEIMRERYRRFRSPELDTPGTHQLVLEMRQTFWKILEKFSDEKILPVVFLCAKAVRNDWRTVPPVDEVGISK